MYVIISHKENEPVFFYFDFYFYLKTLKQFLNICFKVKNIKCS